MISSDTTDNRRTFDENRIAQFESDAIPQYCTVIRAIDMASLGVADIKALQTEVGLHSRLQLSEAPIQFFMLGAVELLKGFKATAEEEALGIGFMDVVIRPTAESGIKKRLTYWNSNTSLRQREHRRPLRRSWTTPVGGWQRTLPPKTSERFQTSKSSPSSSSGRR